MNSLQKELHFQSSINRLPDCYGPAKDAFLSVNVSAYTEIKILHLKSKKIIRQSISYEKKEKIIIIENNPSEQYQ